MSEYEVLIVDDEKEIADLIGICLHNEGFVCVKKYSGEDVMNTLARRKIGLVILDVMMPKIDGITMCHMIREKYNLPIIIISARTMEFDKVLGLASGADDYISKPFATTELVARVRAQIRRYTELNTGAKTLPPGVVEIDGIRLDKNSYDASLFGERIIFTPTEFEILYLLCSNPNKVFSSEDIFEAVWGDKYFEASNNTVMVHIRHLREKLNDDTKTARYIKTVWGVGYKIEDQGQG